MFGKQKSTGKVRKTFEQKLESFTKKLGVKKGEKVRSLDASEEGDKTKTAKESVNKNPQDPRQRHKVSPFRIKSAKTKVPAALSNETGILKRDIPLTDDEKLEQKLATPPVAHSKTRVIKQTGEIAETEQPSRKLQSLNDSERNSKLLSKGDLASENLKNEGNKFITSIDDSSKLSRGTTVGEDGRSEDSCEQPDIPTDLMTDASMDSPTVIAEAEEEEIWDGKDVTKTEEDAVADVEDHSVEWLDEALVLLKNCHMSSAERLLCKTVKCMRELPEKDTEVYVKALNGLTEIYARKAKKARYNPMEAQWWLVVSLTLLKEGINECRTAETKSETLADLATSSANSFRGLDGELMSRLYNNAMAERKGDKNEKATTISPIDETGLIEDKEQSTPDMTWLTKFAKYCLDKIETDSLMDDDDDNETITDDNENQAAEERSLFDDSPEQHTGSAPGSPPGSSEASHALVPYGSNRAIMQKQDSITCDDLNIKPSKPSSTLRRACSLRIKRKSNILRTQSQRERAPPNELALNANSEKRLSVPALLPDNVDNLTRIELLRQKYRAQRLSSSGSSIQEEKGETLPPITEKTLNITLAFAISRLADILLEKRELVLALFLYIRSFNMFRLTEASAVSDKHIGTMLKQMAFIKREQGDTVGAIGFMERALVKFKLVYDDTHREVIDTLFKLGDLYMSKRWHGETVMDNMITVVHNEINKDFLVDQSDFETGAPQIDFDDNMSTAGSVDDLDLSDEESQGGEAYNVSAKEALACYEKVVNTIQDGGLDDEDNFLERAIIKMGDCCFMNDEFDAAMKYYEKSVKLIERLRSVNLCHHAHVLNMIAIVNFIQRNYGKAAKMFSTANVLNQSLLGTNPSNFEIACVYSLWGITCWILKDSDKCLSPCILAYEIFTRLFTNTPHLLPMKRKWLISEVTFILGCTFRELHFFSKAMEYLNICLTNAESSAQQNLSWIIRILIAIGDCHAKQTDYDTALNSYYYYCLDLIKRAKTLTPGLELLRIDLLREVVNIHSKQGTYDELIAYTEELLNCYTYHSETYYKEIAQTLGRLAAFHSHQGDMEKAAKCYNEALDTFQMYNEYLSSEMGPICARLALIYHVQSCSAHSDDEKVALIEKANNFFAKAFLLDSSQFSAVLYLNFLCSFQRYSDAVPIIEKLVYLTGHGPQVLEVYENLLRVMPECIEAEYHNYKDNLLSINALGKYLAIICYINVNEILLAHAYAGTLLSDSLKEQKKPSMVTVITAYAQLLVCEYNKAAVTFGNLYTARQNTNYLEAFWSCCIKEIDTTQLFMCHDALSYIGIDIDEFEENESSEEVEDKEYEEFVDLGETAEEHLILTGDQLSVSETRVADDEEWRTFDTVIETESITQSNDTQLESQQEEEKWTVFEEYTVDESPEIVYQLSPRRREEEWKKLQQYTITDDQAKIIQGRVPGQMINKSVEVDGRANKTSETDQWRVIEEYTVDSCGDSQNETQMNSEDEWKVLDEYTEEETVPINPDESRVFSGYTQENKTSRGSSETSRNSWRLPNNHGDTNHNDTSKTKKSAVRGGQTMTSDVASTREGHHGDGKVVIKEDTLLSQNETLENDSGVESQEFSESHGTLGTSRAEDGEEEEIEEEWIVYEEYTEEYVVSDPKDPITS